jgi:hypothetical protein
MTSLDDAFAENPKISPRAISQDSIDIRFKSIGEQKPIINNCSNVVNKTKVFRIRIGSGTGGLVIKSPNRHTRIKPFNNTGTDEDGSAGIDPPLANVNPKYSPTKYDINIYDYLKNPGDVVLIKIKLMDDQLQFVDPVGTIGRRSITSSAGYGERLFCDLGNIRMQQHNTESRLHPMVTFYAQYLPDVGTAGFNIHILVKDDDGVNSLPIIIDPNVKNEG